MDENMILKIKENEVLEIIKNIAMCYSVFLFFFALVLGFQETIIQVMFILVFALIINIINCGEMLTTEKGISTKKTGFIKFNEIYRIELKDRILYVYTRKSKKIYKIVFADNEDYKSIEKNYKYLDSKIKRIEEDTKEHQEYVKKYFE